MKKINLLLLLLMIPATLAYDFSDTFSYTNDQLPLSAEHTINITAPFNTSVLISQVDATPHVNLTFDSLLNFTNQTILPLTIKYNISKLNITQNTTLTTSLVIQTPNVTKSYGLLFHVEYIPTVNLNPINSFELVDNQYIINISTNALPSQGALNYSIKVSQPITVTFTCSDWLICPTQMSVTPENQSFFIQYAVPADAPLGSQLKSIQATINNVTRSAYITFNIINPKVSIKPFVPPPDCFDEDGIQTEKCIEEEREYLLRIREENLRLRLIRQNLTVYQNVTVEKLVMVGSVDKDLSNLYSNLKDDNEKTRQDLIKFTQKADDLESLKAKLELQLEEDKKAHEARIQEVNTTAYLAINEQKETYRLYIGVTLVGIALILCFLIYAHYWEEGNGKPFW